MSSRRILIVLHGAIGDVTRALPLAVRIKRSWPDTRLSWAVEPASADLVRAHPCVDRTVVFARKEGLSGYRRFVKELREEPYDLVLDLQRHLKSGVTSFLSGGRARLGFHWRNAKELNWAWNNRQIAYADDTLPKILHYQKFGDALGLPPLDPLEFRISPGAELRTVMSERLRSSLSAVGASPGRKLVGCIIGASWESKVWPVERYAELAQALYRDHGSVAVLVGGRAEEVSGASISRAAGVPVLNMCGQTSLTELVSLFECCDYALGSDSGPMHIAAAAGCRVISLWGATNPIRTGPYGSEDLVLQSAIGCSPCYRRKCPGLGTLCMRDIPARAVLAYVAKQNETRRALGEQR